ncbi:CDP-diacylglycerol--glycerol-3-phosphate 3-phosphatidyltransferase [Paremcibacter congregatus]|uniref:CDP-diacylglycerol--glycerol-3-phosphate 3-phosphatidyltransferase n=1 Tax=Paremcibacter congregatus TaxID=2043170 RepID=UPI0030ED984F|tara:strand:+ start:4077 stop:4628 length:552 start_codon:yes stop_codon:yes gene_type:complete
MYNFANLLTFSRILMIPLIVGSFYLDGTKSNWIGFAIFTIAGVTDFFDGYLARKYEMSSALGKFMDPIADKLLIAAALLMMVAFKRIEGLAVIAAVIILCREFAVSGLREFLADLKVSVPVSYLAKWKTTLQMLALGFLLVGEASPDIIPSVMIGNICLWVAALITLYTGYDYLRTGLRHMVE